MAKYIPEKHYITWGNFIDDMPLAFMTVWGEDEAAKNRMSTADSWVRTNKDVLPVKLVLDNEALKGFEIAKEVRRWSTSNVVWRVNDPRGFQLEISSGNMAYILGNCTIAEGAIQDELIWVRDGANNYLLPTSSEEFAIYQRNSIAKESKTKISDVNVGDRISVVSGETGIYLGMYTCVALGGRGEIFQTARYHMIRNEADPNNISYVAKSSWKGIAIEERGASEDQDYSDEINDSGKKIIGPSYIHYVCKGKFDIKKAAAAIKIVPYDNVTEHTFFMNIDNKLYRARQYRHDWESISLNQYIIDIDTNTAGYVQNGHVYVSDSGRNGPITLNAVKSVEKFMYVTEIDGKEYVLEL